jgi:hypothetical protein
MHGELLKFTAFLCLNKLYIVRVDPEVFVHKRLYRESGFPGGVVEFENWFFEKLRKTKSADRSPTTNSF